MGLRTHNHPDFPRENFVSDSSIYKRKERFVATKWLAFLLFLGSLVSIFFIVIISYNFGIYKSTEEKFMPISETEIQERILASKQVQTCDYKSRYKCSQNVRLPTNIIPLHYRLRLQPYINEGGLIDFIFKGHVRITIQATEPGVKEIVLHAKRLTINKKLVTITGPPSLTENNVLSSQPTDNLRDDPLMNDLPSSQSIEATINQNFKPISVSESNKQVSTDSPIDQNFKPISVSESDEQISTETSVSDEAIIENWTQDRDFQSTDENFFVESIPDGLIQLKITKQEYQRDDEKYKIYLDDPLLPNVNYTLEIAYSGEISADLNGFFRSSYKSNDTRKWVALTQFEPTDARKALPCFDEPHLKAQFEISICRRNHFNSLSNMPLVRSENDTNQPGWTWDHFAVSVPMSTYLLAFVISEYAVKETSINNVTIRVWAPKDVIEETRYTVEMAPVILNYLTDYFGVEYPLPKLDLVSTPQFEGAAMENWGIAIFLDYTLINSLNAKGLELFTTTALLAHEIGHQWFGNLVTMKWWTDIWLNEGFATYVEFLATDAVQPTWKVFQKIFSLTTLNFVMELDSYHSTHPVSVNVTDPADIKEIFDSISYKKGGCLIRMLNHSLTEPLLKKGLKNYLLTWKYKNAEQNDLWESLNSVINESSTIPKDITINQIMNSWTLQEGYPVITVTRNYSSESAFVEQKRFLIDNAEDDKLWYVPLSYQNGSETVEWSTAPKTWLKKEPSITIENLAPSSTWVIFNIDQTGFFRVNYDPRNWLMIRDLLMTSPESVPITTRIQLINDALILANTGLLNYSIALNLTLYISQKENDSTVFHVVLKHLMPYCKILRDYPVFDLFRKYLLELILPKYYELGFEGGEEDSEQMREYVIQYACFLQHPHCIEWAKNLFKQWKNSSNPGQLDPVLDKYQDIIFCTAIRFGNAEDWSFLYKQIIENKYLDIKTLSRYLLCSNDVTTLKRYIERIETNEAINIQESAYLWNSIESTTAVDVAFKYLTENWNSMVDKYKQSYAILKSILTSVLFNLHTEFQLKDLLAFYDKTTNIDKDLLNFAKGRSIENTAQKLRWIQTRYPELKAWLENYYENKD